MNNTSMTFTKRDKTGTKSLKDKSHKSISANKKKLVINSFDFVPVFAFLHYIFILYIKFTLFVQLSLCNNNKK